MSHALPKFKAGRGLPTGPRTDKNTRIEYYPESLAQSLSLTIEVGQHVSIDRSALPIPDVWGQPLWFYSVLKDAAVHEGEGPDDSGYAITRDIARQVVGEWRGLLAILALRGQLNIELEVLTVNLEAVGDAKIDSIHQPLHHILAVTTPETVLDPNTKWNPCNVIIGEHGAIGMMSPLTLVCPSADCLGKIPNRVRWRTGGNSLCDPIPLLNSTERGILFEWISHVHSRIHPFLGENDEAEFLLTALARYRNAVQQAGMTPIPWSPAAPILEAKKPDGGVRTLSRMYAPMAEACVHEEEVNHLRIIGHQERQSNTYVLFDAAVAEQWGRSAADVRAAANLNLAMEKPNPPYATTKYLSVGELFLSELFVFPKTWRPLTRTGLVEELCNLKVQSAKSTERDFVLPFSRAASEMLSELFTFNELQHQIEITTHHDGSVTVVLRLPLSGVDKHPTWFTTSRKYSPSSHEITEITLENVDDSPFSTRIWPESELNPPSNQWWFFQLREREDRGQLPLPHLSPLPLRAVANSYVSKPSGHESRCISILTEFPRVFSCLWKGRGESDHIGAVIGRLPPDIPHTNSESVVGIDFGTSSTNIHIKVGEEESARLQFKALSRVLSRSRLQIEDEANDTFLPDGEPAVPFLSLFRTLQIPAGMNAQEESAMRQLPHAGGHIWLFRQPISESVKDVRGVTMRQDVRTNLKWSGERDNDSYLRCFLTQLCAMLKAEVLLRGGDPSIIQWKFAYPSSLWSPDDFRAICSLAATGVANGIPEANFVTEAVANLLYCQKEKIVWAAGHPSLVMDIGAGTTDIAIWRPTNERLQDEEDRAIAEVMLQSSVHFAGRLMLHDAIAKIPEMQKLLIKREGLGTHQWYGAMELQLCKLGDDFKIEYLTGYDGGRAKLRLLLAVAFAGLFHYLGKCVKKTRLTQLPHVAVTGKGSMLYLDRFNLLVSAVYREACGMPPGATQIKTSPAPKEEAASGLLVDTIGVLDGGRDTASTLLGIPATFGKDLGSKGDCDNVDDDVIGNPYHNLTQYDLREVQEVVSKCISWAMDTYREDEAGRQLALRLKSVSIDRNELRTRVLNAARNLVPSLKMPLSLIAFSEARDMLAERLLEE